MKWIEKRPKGPNANIAEDGKGFKVVVRLMLPDGSGFRRELAAGTRTAARKLRDDVYAAYNEVALSILAGEAASRPSADEPASMTLRELAETCRDSWWPARGRSVEVCEQYFQKLRDYVYPVLGEDYPISRIADTDWERILERLNVSKTNRKRLMGTETIRKVKAVLSSALSCAVAHKRLASNPIKGLAYEPNRLAEADRLGTAAEDLDEEEAPAKRMLSDAEAAALLSGAKGSGIYPLVVLQLGFGLRIAEALAVRWADFDPETNELRVRAQVRRRRNPAWREGSEVPKTVLQRVPVLKSKAARREVLALPDALALLATLAPGPGPQTLVKSETGGLMEPRNAQRAFRALVDSLTEAKKVSGPPPTTHSMRSWRISHLANVVGLPASHLMRIAGHSHVETTLLYYVRSDRDSLTQWLAANAREHARSPLAA